MRHYPKIIFAGALLWGLVLMAGTSALAASAEISLDSDQIAVGEGVQLTVTISGASSTERPKINAGDGLSIQFAGTSNQVQIINGAFSSQLSYNYSVAALKPGRYTLGPLTIAAGGKRLRTNSVVLTVTGSASSRNNPLAAGGQSRTDDEPETAGGNPLSLTVNLPKTTIYQGEVVPVTVKLLVGGVSVNQVTYPNLSQSDFVFGKMDKPLQTEETIHGETYKVVAFHTTLTPVKTGTISLGPVALHCDIIVKSQDDDGFFDDFFPNYEKRSVQVQSQKIPLHILPLPEAGKPADFSGGIGQFQLKATATPPAVNQGDPITVRLALSGEGNIAAINPPVLQNAAGFKVYDPQRKSSASGEVAFEQVLIPVDAKIKQISPYVFSYFNPVAGAYQRIVTPAIPVSVKANPGFDESSGVESSGSSEHFGRDLVFIKDSPGKLRLIKDRLYYQPWFWIWQLLPVLGLLAAYLYSRYQKMLQSDTPAARAIRAGNWAKKQLENAGRTLAAGKPEPLLDELYRIIRNYLAQKYNLNAAGMTGDVVDNLGDKEIPETTLQEIKDFFGHYDFYRFTGAAITRDDARQLWEEVHRIIEDLNHSSGKTNSNGSAAPASNPKGARNQ